MVAKFHEYHFRKNSDTLNADVTINILRKIVLQREKADVKYANAAFIGGGIFQILVIGLWSLCREL